MTPDESNRSFEAMIRQLIEDLRPHGEEWDKRRFPASILNQDGQEIANGQAMLEELEFAGVFWPAPSLHGFQSPESASILSASDGRRFLLSAFRVQRSESAPPYFVFRYSLLEPLPESP